MPLPPARLAKIAAENNLTLVHVSSDYIFDGTQKIHAEEEIPSPLSTYGASKAAGDTAAQTAPRHYVIRTSWVFGDGNNFMSTMASLAKRNIEPVVINDQKGRPTYAEDLAKGIKHLLETQAEYGVYNLSSAGDAVDAMKSPWLCSLVLATTPLKCIPQRLRNTTRTVPSKLQKRGSLYRKRKHFARQNPPLIYQRWKLLALSRPIGGLLWPCTSRFWKARR
jgi:dTDP-4-dehydrorhamnose reductase